MENISLNKSLLVALQFFAFSVQAYWSGGVALGAHLQALNVAAVFTAVQVASLLAFGLLADRVAPKQLLVISAGLFSIGAVALFGGTLPWIVAGQALSGAAAGSMVVIFAAANRHTADDDRSYAMRRLVGFVWFGIGFGQIVGHAVLERFGLTGFAATSLVGAMVIVVVVAKLPDLPRPPRMIPESIRARFSPAFGLTLVISFLAAASGSVLQTRVPFLFEENSSVLTFLICVAAGGGVWVSRRRRFQQRNESGILSASLAVIGIGFLVPTSTDNPWAIGSAFFLIGMMIAIGDACFQSIIGIVSRPSSTAMSIGIFLTVATGGKLVATLLAKSPSSFAAAAFISFIAAFLAILLYTRVETHIRPNN